MGAFRRAFNSGYGVCKVYTLGVQFFFRLRRVWSISSFHFTFITQVVTLNTIFIHIYIYVERETM